MDKKPIFISLDGTPRFGVGTVIAIYGNAARHTQSLGRCIAAAAIGGSFGPFSADRERETRFSMFDTIDNDFDTGEATEAIYDMAESSEYYPDGAASVRYRSAISCSYPSNLMRLALCEIEEAKPNILIISGAEDIPKDVKSLAEIRAALRWFKRVAQLIKGIVILEFGMKPSYLIKTALIDNCNYAFLTEEDESQRGRITVTATRWQGEPIPTMYIDTDPKGVPTITIDEAETKNIAERFSDLQGALDSKLGQKAQRIITVKGEAKE